MLELIDNLVPPNQYIPHGHCYLWQTPLVALHVVSDGLIAIAYFSIPAMLLYFVRKRQDDPLSKPLLKVFLLFGAFIVLCGAGHLLDIWTVWYPAYWVSGLERALTALVSCYTALQLVELLPQFLSLRSPQQLELANQALEEEIAQRKQTEATLDAIVAGTAAVTGKDFFAALTQNLATALNVSCVAVCEAVEDSQKLRTLALWSGDRLAESIEYSLAGGPCEAAIESKSLCAFSDKVQQHFPNAHLLKELGAESFVGVPLLDANQQTIGQLCILDVQPFQIDDRTKGLFNVFAARAAIELQRKWAEDEKVRAYEALELRVQERTAELVQTNTALGFEIRERTATQFQLQQLAERERTTARVIQRMRQSL
ncbi:MAG TPA: GAF domain-containing protein, partial [Thermosynechococcaceae cyanobacterium]